MLAEIDRVTTIRRLERRLNMEKGSSSLHTSASETNCRGRGQQSQGHQEKRFEEIYKSTRLINTNYLQFIPVILIRKFIRPHVDVYGKPILKSREKYLCCKIIMQTVYVT